MTVQRRRASISDVAARAGVAVGTVSNVMNRPELVAPATLERVRAAIEELSFVRSGVARQLRAGTITTVGAVLLDIRNPFFTEVARGIEDRLAQDDFTLMLASSDEDPGREATYLRLFEEHGVVGVLLVPSSADLSLLLEVQRRGVRVVLLDAESPVDEISSVAVDDCAGGAMAARHLLEQGHRRIVMLNGAPGIRQCAARRAGVDVAVAEAGLDPGECVREVQLGSLDAAGGDAAIRMLVDVDGSVPEAIFCVNDLVAIGVQRALRRLGGTACLRRTAVVGYDDIDVAAELAVPLTSVRQPARRVGRRATELLLDPPEGAPVEHILFSPELVVRESSLVGGGRAAGHEG